MGMDWLCPIMETLGMPICGQGESSTLFNIAIGLLFALAIPSGAVFQFVKWTHRR